jgi:hypothetical protein
MKILFLINFILSFGIAIFIFINFWKKHKIPELRKSFNLFLLIGLLYLILSTISLLWSFNIFQYALNDFLLIKSLMILLQTIFLFNLIYIFRNRRKIFYFLFCYLGILSAGLIGVSISSILLMCSFIITLLLFVLLISVERFEKISKFGILYASISLIIQILSLFFEKLYVLGSVISNLLFFVLIFYFIRSIENFPIESFHQKMKYKKRYYFLDFLRYFIFIIILTNFIFIGTITVHEVGHLLTSRAFDCGFERIIYEGGLPHTEILCGENFNSLFKVILGGMLLPLAIAILFFFAGGTFIKEVGLLIGGFDLIISYKDLLNLGLSTNLGIFFSVIGGIFVLVSIALLARSRTTEDELLHLI